MATIDKQANGSVKIVRNSQIVYLNNLDNVTVTTEGSTDGNPIVIIAYEGGQQVFSIAEITSINGSPKPATVADTVELLALEVFKFGGGSGIGATGDNGDTFAVLNSNVWNRSLYANVERHLTADETLSITNDTAAFSWGVLYLTANGHTLTLPSDPSGIVLNEDGETTLVYNKRAGVYHWTSNGVPPAPSIPVITLQPLDQDLDTGDTLTLTVDYTGYPAPTIQWEKSTDSVSYTTISGATSKTYTKTSVEADAAEYRAVVTNSQGEVTSESATVTVADAAPVSTTPTLLTVASSDGINLANAPSYQATDQVNNDEIHPMLFNETLAAGADGLIMFSINSSSGGDLTIDTRNVYFGFSETATYTDPTNVSLNLKVGLFREISTGNLIVKDNDGFYGEFTEVAHSRVSNTYSQEGRRIGIKRTSGVYTVVQSNDYGATFFTLYTFINYSYNGKLYVMAGIIDGGFSGNSSLAYPLQIGLS